MFNQDSSFNSFKVTDSPDAKIGDGVLNDFTRDFNFDLSVFGLDSPELQLKLKEKFECIKKVFLNSKEEVLNVFHLAKSDNDTNEQVPTLRKNFTKLYYYLYFFSDISSQEVTYLHSYNSVFGNLKDKKSWSVKHDKLIEDLSALSTMIQRLNFNSDLSVKKFELLKKEVFDLMNTPESLFDERVFHGVRKSLRALLFFVRIISQFNQNSDLQDIEIKYTRIVYNLGKVRDHKKTFAWKQMLLKYVH